MKGKTLMSNNSYVKSIECYKWCNRIGCGWGNESWNLVDKRNDSVYKVYFQCRTQTFLHLAVLSKERSINFFKVSYQTSSLDCCEKELSIVLTESRETQSPWVSNCGPRQTALALPKNLLEMRTLRLRPRPKKLKFCMTVSEF